MKISSYILRHYQAIHTWTGITSGLLLFIGFFAGALVMFKPVISDWATPPSDKLAQINIKQLDTLTQQILREFPQAQKHLVVSFDEDVSPLTWLEKGNDNETFMADRQWHASLDHQGHIESHSRANNELGYLLDLLHRTAGIAGEVGHDHVGGYVLGIASFLYFIALVSGVIILMPTLVKRFFALRTKAGANRFWLDSHNLVGIASLPFHIVIALTVVVFSLHDFLYGGLAKVYNDKPLFAMPTPSTVEYQLDALPKMSVLLKTIEEYAPEHKVHKIKLSGLDSVTPFAIVLLKNDSNMMVGPVADFVFMNPYTLRIQTSSIAVGDQGIWGQLVTGFFALHFGSYGGELGRWAYFTLGMMGAFLFYSGNLLWLEKRRQKNKAQTRSVSVMASLTVGVCLGSLLGVSMCFAATKWLTAFTDCVNQLYLTLYYVTFFSVLFVSFKKGAAEAAMLFLRLLAWICLSIPFTSIFGFFMPNIGVWPASGFSQICLELLFIIFAGVFYWAFRANKRRAYNGDKNSVWSMTA